MPPFRRRAAIGLVAAAVVWVAWQATRPPVAVSGWECNLCFRRVELRGRLVRASDGTPIVDVGVLALGHEMSASDAAWALSDARRGTSWGRRHALTAEDGTFRVLHLQRIDCGGCGDAEKMRPDRDSLHGLALERVGGGAWILTDLPEGAWTKPMAAASEDVPHALWDLGDVVMPSR